MLSFLKENGFPKTVHVETSEHKDDDDNVTYESVITDEKGDVLSIFEHMDLRARIHWVNGFFTALKFKNENKRKL